MKKLEENKAYSQKKRKQKQTSQKKKKQTNSQMKQREKNDIFKGMTKITDKPYSVFIKNTLQN